jgi:hypothetical protein
MKKFPAFRFARVIVIFSVAWVSEQLVNSCAVTLRLFSLATLEKCGIRIKSSHDTGTEGQHQPPCYWWWSGPGAKAPVALQPLRWLYTLFSTSSHCRHQMSPHHTGSERSKQREVELMGGKE